MCLYANRDATEALRKKMGDKPRRAWKVYWRNFGKLRSLWRHTRVFPGTIRSNRRRQTWKRPRIERGIHVFLDRREAEGEGGTWEPQFRVVPVTVRAADLVAANSTKNGAFAQAVFMKVHLTKRAYNTAMRDS